MQKLHGVTQTTTTAQLFCAEAAKLFGITPAAPTWEANAGTADSQRILQQSSLAGHHRIERIDAMHDVVQQPSVILSRGRGCSQPRTQLLAWHPTVVVTVNKQVCHMYMLMLICPDVSSYTFLMHYICSPAL